MSVEVVVAGSVIDIPNTGTLMQRLKELDLGGQQTFAFDSSGQS